MNAPGICFIQDEGLEAGKDEYGLQFILFSSSSSLQVPFYLYSPHFTSRDRGSKTSIDRPISSQDLIKINLYNKSLVSLMVVLLI